MNDYVPLMIQKVPYTRAKGSLLVLMNAFLTKSL